MSVRFDAGDDSALFDDGAPTGDFTFMGWHFRSADLDAFETIFWSGADGTDSAVTVAVYVNNDVLEVWALNGAAARITGGTTISTDTWYHITLVGNTGTAQNLTLYLNTDSEGTGTTGDGTYAAERVQLGRDPFGDQFNGRVAAWKLWNAQLTEIEIEAEINRFDAVRTADLWQNAKLRLHTDLTDSSGNGRNFTAVGTLSTEADPPGVTDGPGFHFQPAWVRRPSGLIVGMGMH